MKRKVLFVTALLMLLSAACYAQTLCGTYYFPDKPFPEYMDYWKEGWSFKDDNGDKLIYAKPGMPLGGYIFLYFKNASKKPITITDLSIEGIKMSEALGKTNEPRDSSDRYRASILLSKLPAKQISKLKDAGWVAWWKPEPATVEPGGYGEIIIRNRRPSKLDSLNISIILDTGKINTVVNLNNKQPQFGTISFTPDLKTVYIYSRHPKTGVAPKKVMIDGVDVTSSAVISSDKSLNLASAVVSLTKPLKLMSYHSYKILYADGSSAQAGIRSWGHEMIYGMWSSPARISDPEKAFKSFIDDYKKHNINCVMPYVIGAERDYFDSDEGWKYCESQGIGRMLHWMDGKHDPTILFAMDEPDANDANNVDKVKPEDRLGMYGQWLVEWTRVMHKCGPNTPVLLNIDNTYKPENWYMYHQLTDIPCADPYFPEQLDQTYWNEPGNLSVFTKPTYVQGIAAISQSSAQPKPLHLILCSTQYANDKGQRGRFPTPEEKRMEVYYSVALGAKGLSYWWFPRDRFCNGCSDDGPEGSALWKEIGLLGAEVRTASPIITTSCPIDLDIKASRFLWVRSLASGNDTLAVIAVNDNVASDRVGTVYKPVENAKATVTIPSWIKPKDVFEITVDGIKDVKSSLNGSSITLDMGKVELNKFVVITSNPELKAQLQKRYNDMFAANVAALRSN